jgi:hypothetical protein
MTVGRSKNRSRYSLDERSRTLAKIYTYILNIPQNNKGGDSEETSSSMTPPDTGPATPEAGGSFHDTPNVENYDERPK